MINRIYGFIGRQISRTKLTAVLYTMVMSTITALGVIGLYLNIPSIVLLIGGVIIGLISFAIFGYILDKSDISTADFKNTIDISHRYVNTQDLKNQEFYLCLFKTLATWFNLDITVLEKNYKKYLKKWSKNDKNK